MKNSTKVMFLFGIVVFVIMLIIIDKGNFPSTKESPIFWFYRILIALAASSVSISIPGMIKINYKKDGTVPEKDEPAVTVLDRAPEISASGAIAVFVLILFV